MSYISGTPYAYAGPSLSGIYPTLGTLYNNQTVTAIFREGSFVFVEYTPTNSSKKTRAYVSSSNVTVTESISTFTAGQVSRYVNVRSTVTYGPGSGASYNSGDILATDTAVTYLGRKEQGYAFVEYTSGTMRKRAYIYANNLALPLSDQLGSVLANFGNPGYSNAFTNGQCTWYCWGRAYEKCGRSLTFSGGSNGNQWYANVSGGYSSKRSRAAGPVKNSVCSCGANQEYGHVLFIEGVQGGYVYFTEANWGDTDGELKRLPLSTFADTRNVIGYIVL